MFQWGLILRWGGFIFKWEAPHASVLVVGHGHHPPPPTMGNPVNFAGNERQKLFYKDYHHN